MSEQLPSPKFDSQNYERPNQKWICGHAAEGQPCRLGPNRRGRCQADFKCAPVLETKPGETKGRWRCTRPGQTCDIHKPDAKNLACWRCMHPGGPCETGPLPDGTCCRPIPKCSPLPTLRTQRGRLTLTVVAATVGVLLIVLGSPPLRRQFITPGALSAPHSSAAFAKLHAGTNHLDQTCTACHKAGALGPSGLAIAAFHASPGPLEITDLARARPAEMMALDAFCQKCHKIPISHQPNVERDLSCSFCHPEHRGGGPMLAPTEANCTFCHSDAASMAAAAAKGVNMPSGAFHSRVIPGQNAFPATRPSSGFTQVIHRFSGDHPEFRVNADKLIDPDTLKFGHALHLTGQTIPKLPSGEKLTCAFCHQPEAAGVYFRPINFESNCRICHSLQFDPESPGLTLPHGPPKLASAFLHSLPKQYADYAERTGITGASEQRSFVQKKLQHLQALVVSAEDFEKNVFFSNAMAGPPAQVGSVSGATRALFPGCVYCHEVKTDSQGGPEITKPVIFDRWLLHGRFDHTKHAKVACVKCHQAEQSKVTADIILPSKDTCAACHSPSGGVADSCITCHGYHPAWR